jgi:hypothetical protein
VRRRCRPAIPIGGRRRGERGVVGGIEVLPFGFLIFVAGALVIANAWAVVDARLTVDAAAREAARAYVESRREVEAEHAARRAAEDVVRGTGRDPAALQLRERARAFERCERVVVDASYRVPALTVPFVGGFGGGLTVTGRHSEIIDPFADGLTGGAACDH